MKNGKDPSKEESVPVIDQVKTLNEEADQIKKASKACRNSIHQSLVVLYEMIDKSKEFSEETTSLITKEA